jgi:hypothetical protein
VSSAHLLKWRPVVGVIRLKESGLLDFAVSVGLINIPKCQMDTSVDLRIAKNVACILIPAERVSVMNVETCIDSKKEMNQLGSAMNARNHLKSVLVVKSVSQICLDNVLTVTMLTVMFGITSMTTANTVLRTSLVRSSERPPKWIQFHPINHF